MNFRHTEKGELRDIILSAGDYIAVDLETTGLEHTDKIVAGVVAYSEDEAVMFTPEECPALLECKVPMVLHNWSFDARFLYRAGVDIRTCNVPIRDTMFLHALLDENAPHKLDHLVQQEYGDDYKKQFWAKHKKYEDAPPYEQLEYACKDVIYTYRLYQLLVERLRSDGIPDSLIEHVHKLSQALFDTEVRGVKIDFDQIVSAAESLKGNLAVTKERLDACTDFERDWVELELWQKEMAKRKTPKGKAGVKRPQFNWASTDHLARLIFGKLMLPVQGTSRKTGKPQVDDGALEKLSGKHPCIELLREWRGYQKTYGTYIEGTLDRQVEGRIYPTFNVSTPVTGRISSSNPNLQNIPKDNSIRGIYVPDPGHKLVSADYGMLEVVIAAHYSQDPMLLKIIHEGASKHDITADALGVPRSLAKTLNFAMGYLCSAHKVAKLMKCSHAEAEEVWKDYWNTYAGERRVIEECIARVNKGEPIVNMFGRKRRLAIEASDPQWLIERKHRQGYNALIQGTGAQFTQMASIELSRRMAAEGLGRYLWEVHDEVLVEAKEGKVDIVRKVVYDTMVNLGKQHGLTVPLTCEVSEGLDRWQK